MKEACSYSGITFWREIAEARPMRFLLAASGSRGDFQPMLALALGLRAAGHDATLAARPAYAPEAAAFGVPFHPVGEDPETFLRRPRAQPGAPVDDFLLQELDAALDSLPPLAAQADRVVGAGMSLGARSVAEAAGVPYLAVAYAPGVLTPRGVPPIGLPAPLLERALGWRARRGLPPVEHLVLHAFPPERTLLAADPEFVGSGLQGVALWAPPIGALHLPDPRPLSADVEAFLSAGEPPVYVGFGSVTGMEPALTPQLVREAVEAAGCRALLLTPAGHPAAGDPGGRVLSIGPSAHGALFPRVAAAVHHGGAGTTAAAARAGVAQVLVPHAFDQFYWAAQVRRLGIAPAPPLAARGIDAARLAAALTAALCDSHIRGAARALGPILASRRGVEAAVELLAGPLP